MFSWTPEPGLAYTSKCMGMAEGRQVIENDWHGGLGYGEAANTSCWENIEEMYLISVGKADINARCNGKRTREREKSEQD